MDIIFDTIKIEKQCTNLSDAQKVFGGDKSLAISLLSRINTIRQAETLHDIIALKPLRFHNLHNKKGRDLEGYFAIDVKNIKIKWRIILQLLDINKEEFNPCHIDKIINDVRYIKIKEVSPHYE